MLRWTQGSPIHWPMINLHGSIGSHLAPGVMVKTLLLHRDIIMKSFSTINFTYVLDEEEAKTSHNFR